MENKIFTVRSYLQLDYYDVALSRARELRKEIVECKYGEEYINKCLLELAELFYNYAQVNGKRYSENMMFFDDVASIDRMREELTSALDFSLTCKPKNYKVLVALADTNCMFGEKYSSLGDKERALETFKYAHNYYGEAKNILHSRPDTPDNRNLIENIAKKELEMSDKIQNLDPEEVSNIKL